MKPELQAQFDKINKGFLRDSPLVAILNSHQSKRPCGRDPWVRSTSSAADELVKSGRIVVTSIGLNTWEVAVHLVNSLGGRQLIVIPAKPELAGFNSTDEIVSQFCLEKERTEFLTLNEDSVDRSDWSTRRDELIAELAAQIYPISLRSGGRLEELCHCHQDKLDTSFQIKYARPLDQPRYNILTDQLNPLLSGDWHYLTHWTRSSHEPYPGEDRFTYYQSIIESSDYPNSALHTLERIIADRMITGSNRFIRGGHQVVSLTSLLPRESLKLMRWRRRYVYYSFEPYGVAIDHEAAVALGCRKVIYAQPAQYDNLPMTDQPFFQNEGTAGDWRPENEWRCLGNLKLTDLPEDKILLITHTPEEAILLQGKSRYRVLPLTRSAST